MDLAQFDLLAARVEELLQKCMEFSRRQGELESERDGLLARLEASERELETLRKERDVIRERVDTLLGRLDEGSVA